MSGDFSPGSGLEVPARPKGEDDASATIRRPGPAEPSLLRVVGTTLRLWLRRRVLRVRDDAGIGALRWTAVTVAVLLVAGAAAGGLAASLTASQPAPIRPRHHAAPAPKISIAQAQTTANEQAAAAWIASQVSSGATVGCDPVMCADLQSAGFPARQQATVQPASALPGGGDLVVATAVIRAGFGLQLAAAARQVIATFGTGAQVVQVRVVSTGTPAAFRAAAKAAVAADKRLARTLSRARRLHLYGSSRQELLTGLVDRRLMVVLGRLLTAHPVYVAGFGDAGPGASWPSELRAVNIVDLVRGTGKHRVSDLSSVLGLLHRQRSPYRPMVSQKHSPGGRVTLTIEFPAPSPV